ncbi:hypothetical protein WG906_09730 [Pedobacter sp. P351]|uniref:hypothetical protein n=1 Tax=Pedobacter superstes TaxID=3133441 RepID=UPI0030A9C5C9
MAKQQRKITFKYMKSHDFRSVIVNGIFGGVNTRGNLAMNFYVETHEIPKSTEHIMLQDGKLSPLPIVPEKDVTVIRELPFGILVDLNTAKSIVEWMQKHIAEHELKKSSKAVESEQNQ